MIPLRDTVPNRRIPVLTWILILVNAAVFLWELSLGAGLEARITTYGFIPARFFAVSSHAGLIERFLPVLTSMFFHGGWLHLIGNMLYLFIFGDNVEDTFGHVLYLLFYLGCGTVSALVQSFAAPGSSTPMVGASGAIAGILGAYFVLFPNARVVTLIPIFIFFQIIEIPAFFFLLFWFLLQFLSGALTISSAPVDGGVAFWAHVGGFATGLGVSLLYRIGSAAKGSGRSYR